MKQNFRGWNTVFNFTFRQTTKGAGFKVVTALMTILIIGAFILINVLVAKPDKENKVEVSPIKTVFVLDQSGLQPTDYKTFNPELSSEQFQHIRFEAATTNSKEELIEIARKDGAESIAVIISTSDGGFEMEAAIPSGSIVTENQAQDVLMRMQSSFASNKLMQTGLTAEQLNTLLKPVVTMYSEIGENTNEIVYVIKLIAPMLFGLVLYMMLLLYGQNISKSVSTEKTSKLMETLLISVHPYALITGKVLAVTTMAVLQFLIWIIAGGIGLYGGNAIAHAFYPEYENSVITIINFLKDNIGETAMSVPAVVIAILVFCIGFLFYCIIAGLAGSMVGKPEDVATSQSLFTLPIVISFLVCYLAPITENEGLLTVARFIPFTIPFSIPVDLITGSVSLLQGVVSLLILAVFSFLVIILSARIYKGLVLYNGQKVNLKLIGNILKANK